MARLLLVEDAADQRMIISARLKKAGHAVFDVGTAAEALDIVTERGLPDLAVLDVGLPDLDGPQLLARLRSVPGGAALPAIFLSASVTEQDIARGEAAGARYLTKPFIANALLVTIEKTLAEGRQSPVDGW